MENTNNETVFISGNENGIVNHSRHDVVMPNESVPYFVRYPNPPTYKRGYDKIHRNDKCPCGSGLKYKKCHLN